MQHFPATIIAKYSRRFTCDTDHKNAAAIAIDEKKISICIP